MDIREFYKQSQQKQNKNTGEFTAQSNKNNTKQDFSQYQETIDKYKNLSQEDLYSELLSQASDLKSQGKLDTNMLNTLSNTLYPMLNDEQKQIFDAAKVHVLPINASRGKLGLADTPLLLIYLIDKDAEKKKNDTRESIKTNADVVAYSIIISGDGKESDGPTTLSIRG